MTNFDVNVIFNFKTATDAFPFIIKGLGYTLLIGLGSMTLGLLAGFFIALGRMSEIRLLRWTSRLYISFMRGTPLLVLLFILYYGLPNVGIKFSAFTAVMIGFTINVAAYIAEVIRASLYAVPSGQWEAARSLGLSYWQTMKFVVLPQAVRIALPPMSNILLDVVKGTSLASVITVPELMYQAKIVSARTFETLTMYIMIALIYWAICIVLSLLQEFLENRYSKYAKR